MFVATSKIILASFIKQIGEIYKLVKPTNLLCYENPEVPGLLRSLSLACNNCTFTLCKNGLA